MQFEKLSAQTDEVARLFDALDKSGNAGAGEVYPGQTGIVITQQEASRTLEAMTWGFPLVTADMRQRAQKAGKHPRLKPVNNARMDKVDSPFWKRWYQDPAHHCLIPISAFAEAYPASQQRSDGPASRCQSLNRLSLAAHRIGKLAQ